MLLLKLGDWDSCYVYPDGIAILPNFHPKLYHFLEAGLIGKFRGSGMRPDASRSSLKMLLSECLDVVQLP